MTARLGGKKEREVWFPFRKRRRLPMKPSKRDKSDIARKTHAGVEGYGGGKAVRGAQTNTRRKSLSRLGEGKSRPS